MQSNENQQQEQRRILLYKTLMKPVLLYGCETWKVNKGDEKKINIFQGKCLRRILKIGWQERVTNQEVLQRTDVEKLSDDIRTKTVDVHPTYNEKRTRQRQQCSTNMYTERKEEEGKATDNMAKDNGDRKDTCRMEIVE